VVYEDIFDAKNACDHLSGFNVCNRYLVVLYYQSNKVSVMNGKLVKTSMGCVGVSKETVVNIEINWYTVW